MPVRRRRPKRRHSVEAELESWRCLFECGHDFFSDLEEFGFATEPAARAAAPEAWDRLGAFLMGSWRPEGPPPHRQVPWAFEQFGAPSAARNAR